ncbi:hypothetical protein OF83DRAFT_1179941 [Amylostereum chailletii]|nr:hypothetical protein OF83DRAFT_1179941 [Amylostereum chailletii]
MSPVLLVIHIILIQSSLVEFRRDVLAFPEVTKHRSGLTLDKLNIFECYQKHLSPSDLGGPVGPMTLTSCPASSAHRV